VGLRLSRAYAAPSHSNEAAAPHRTGLVWSFRVPVFSLAALWDASAQPLEAGAVVGRLTQGLAAAQPPEIHVALLESDACAEIRLELANYPRAFVTQLAAEVEQSGGTLVELWRLSKSEREAFRATALPDGVARLHRTAEEAAQAIRDHLEQLSASDSASSDLTPGPLLGPDEDAPPDPPQPSSVEHRRAPRYDVSLQVAFRTDAEFLHEYATNISRGGLFIRTGNRPEVDSVVSVTVWLPTGEMIKGEALVVHVREGNEPGVGLTFISESRTFSESLDHYLAQLATVVPPED
jgi:uncharacterized protein (TIGR02266 family)